MSQDRPQPPSPFAAKRRAPPKVPAVTLDGIRYEQAVLATSEADGAQRTGYLAAYGGVTGECLWRLRVYEVQVDTDLERDVQDVYFAKMSASPDGRELNIANERREQFAVDVRTQAVRRIES